MSYLPSEDSCTGKCVLEADLLKRVDFRNQQSFV